jgi:hypothetical protein
MTEPEYRVYTCAAQGRARKTQQAQARTKKPPQPAEPPVQRGVAPLVSRPGSRYATP